MLAVDASAQSATTGAVEGRVTDARTGEPLPGVTVWVTGDTMPEPQTTMTEGDGTYKVTQLLPGTYTVTFYADALVVRHENVRVGANDSVSIHPKIKLDDPDKPLGDVIIVKDRPPPINPSSTTKGSKMDRPFIEKVPTPGRGFEGAAGTQPGTHNDGYGLAVSGSTSLENRYLVDGIDITGLTYGTVGTPILSEFIEEVEVIAGGYSAEWGRAIGGIVNVITRSGTNELRGTVFGTISPSVLARDVKETPINTSSIDIEANRVYNADFGVGLGGPVIKDRLFFYVGLAPQLSRTDYTRITRRQTDCRVLLDSGQLSTCDNRLPASGGYADGAADVDPSTGFYITDELDRDVRTGTGKQLTALGKLALAVSPDHQAQLSLIAVPNESQTPGLVGLPSTGRRASGLTTDAALRWTSKLDDGKTELEAVVAIHRSTSNAGAIDPALDLEPRQMLYDGNLGTWAALGGESARTGQGCTDGGASDPYSFIENCPVQSYAIGGAGSLTRDREERKMARLGLTQRLGTHEIKAGLDMQHDSKRTSRLYSGGAFLENFVGSQIDVTRWVSLAPADSKDPRYDQVCSAPEAGGATGMGGSRTFACDYLSGVPGSQGTFVDGETINWAAYLRDSWRIRTNLTLNVGVRYEEQRLRYASSLRGQLDALTGNRLGRNAMVLDGNFAPRVGVIWDPTEEGRAKVYGAWGRFFESIPMDINDRSFGAETSYTQTFAVGGGENPCGPVDPSIGGPNGRGCLDSADPPSSERLLGSSGVLVAPGIKAQYMDEVLAGVEYALASDLKLSVTYQNRRLGRVIEDVSTDGASTYIIANPGEWSADEERKLEQRLSREDDPMRRGRLERELRLFRGVRGFDRPKRSYDALEVSISHRLSRGLFVQASYTYSRTFGNFPGSLSYDNGQVDPNISSQYDLIELLANRNGKLPQDRPHSVKLDGHYTFDLGKRDALTLGGRIRFLSGIPQNALGAHYLYGPDESFLLPRGAMGRGEIEHSVDVHLAYARKLSKNTIAEVYLDVFNLYDKQGTFEIDQTYAPAVRRGGGPNNVNPITGGDYEDLIFAKAIDGQGNESLLPTARNPNFGKTVSRYAPTSARVGFRLTF